MARCETITTGDPLSRRHLLRSTAAMAGASVALASSATLAADDSDAELLAMETEIERLHAERLHVHDERVMPLSAERDRQELKWLNAGGGKASPAYQAWGRWEKESGFAAAIDDQDALCAQADGLIERMWSTPATSAVGKAAKVRVLFKHVMSADWDGPSEDLDWDIGLARRLFLDLAGMSEADLGGVS